MLQKLFLLLGIFLLSLPAAQANVNAIATFSILGDVVAQVGGDKIDLRILVGPGADTHTFEPTPQDSIDLGKADIIFENGLHFEHWLDDMYAASGSKARRVVVTQSMLTIARHYEDNPSTQEDGSDDVDPHVWQDVNNVIVIADEIANSLAQLDPTNAAYYKNNAERYIQQLGELNYWIIDLLKDIPDEKRKLLTSHDSLGYFAKRYGFKVIATVIPSSTTEAEDPSAKQMSYLMKLIRDENVKAVFTETISNSKLIQSLTQDAGLTLARPLYTDALGVRGSSGDTYIGMIKSNVEIIAEALK